MVDFDKKLRHISNDKDVPVLSSQPSPSLFSSGPNTPTTETCSVNKSEFEVKSALQILTQRESEPHSPHCNSPTEAKPSFDFNQSRLFSLITSNETFPSPSETTIRLKIRFISKDLWFNITFNNNLTAAQVRDICLKKAYTFDEEVDEQELVVLSPSIADDVTEISRTLSVSQTSTLSPKAKDSNWYQSYALFWSSAGHWLDGFRKLSSYMLREDDVLELQERDQFIFIPPTVYHEHYAEGWLYKLCGGLNAKWKRRWFILKGESFWQFRRRREASPLGQASLEAGFQISETSVEHNGAHVSCLILKFGAKSWWLRGTCVEDLHHWRRIFITLHNEIDHPSRNTIISSNNRYSVVSKPPETTGEFEGSSLQDNSSSLIKVKAGFMFRRIPITQGYRERYFVLKGRELSCYRSDRFDKANAMTPILLHTVEGSAYEENGLFYIKITDTQSSGRSIKENWDNKSFRKSVLSSTRSLSIKAASWIRKKRGGQQDTELFYLTSKQDWETWREAFELIAGLKLAVGPSSVIKPKSSSGRSMSSRASSSSSNWFKLANRKPLQSGLCRTQTNKNITLPRPTPNTRLSRFSAFINNNSALSLAQGISPSNLPPSLSFEATDPACFNVNQTSISLVADPTS